MLVNMNQVLIPAKKGKYAVGLFNAVNLELARGIIAAAESLRSPVIMGTAEVLLPYGPLEEVSYYLLPMEKKASVPVVIHLDHGLKKETCLKALELGFSSIMYDCSTDSYEEFVEKTGVDALAIAVGTAHGAYKLPPKLDFERIRTIAGTVNVPLVLHGGSGLTDSDFNRAIHEGISKVNIFTDINVAAVEAEFRKFEYMGKGIIDLIPAAVEAVKQETEKKMKLFSSVNKANEVLSHDSKMITDADVQKIVQMVIAELSKKRY